MTATRVNPDTRVKDLTEEEVARLREFIDRNYKVEGDLRREVDMNIKRLIEINCYRGMRHRRNLPVHGQRTRTNARTRRASAQDGGRAQEGSEEVITVSASSPCTATISGGSIQHGGKDAQTGRRASAAA